MPIVWLRLIRDAVPSFGAARAHVLFCLGLRMDRNGTGYASHETLAADAKTSEHTARRATMDARGRGYLVQTRRGHRVTDETVVASAWQLTDPTQPATDTPLAVPQ